MWQEWIENSLWLVSVTIRNNQQQAFNQQKYTKVSKPWRAHSRLVAAKQKVTHDSIHHNQTLDQLQPQTKTKSGDAQQRFCLEQGTLTCPIDVCGVNLCLTCNLHMLMSHATPPLSLPEALTPAHVRRKSITNLLSLYYPNCLSSKPRLQVASNLCFVFFADFMTAELPLSLKNMTIFCECSVLRGATRAATDSNPPRASFAWQFCFSQLGVLILGHGCTSHVGHKNCCKLLKTVGRRRLTADLLGKSATARIRHREQPGLPPAHVKRKCLRVFATKGKLLRWKNMPRTHASMWTVDKRTTNQRRMTTEFRIIKRTCWRTLEAK